MWPALPGRDGGAAGAGLASSSDIGRGQYTRTAAAACGAAARYGGAVRRWYPLFRFVVAATLVAVVVATIDVGRVVGVVRGAPTWALGLSTAVLAVNSVVHALRIRVLLPEPRPALGTVLRSVLLGNFLGLVLPTGGGEAAKAVALSRLSDPPSSGVLALLVSRFLELPPWALLLFWGAWRVLPGRLDAYVPLTVACGVAFLALFVVGARVLYRGQGPAWLRRRVVLPPPDRRPGPAALAWCALGALPFAALNCLVVWGLLRGFGVAIGYGEVLGLIPAMDVVISLPVTVSGAGVRELVFAHGLASWGVTPEVALAVAWLRWSGELVRSLVGGVWWAVGGTGVTRS